MSEDPVDEDVSQGMLHRVLCLLLVAFPAGACGDAEPARIDLLSAREAGVGEPVCTRAEACAAPTPYCHLDDCVECLTDDNCGNDNCDPVAHVCVKCVTSGDCPNDKPYCHENECVECLQTANCGDESEVCDLADNKCKPSCASDDDCSGSKSICSPSTTLCVECLVDSDCSGDEAFCEEFKCVQCRDDADCDDTIPICDAGKLECVQCLSDSDCEGDAVCDKKTCN